MKISVDYTHSLQSSADITIDEADYLAWCKGQYLKGTDDFLLTSEHFILEYLNWDPQFLSELIGWGEADNHATNINFE